MTSEFPEQLITPIEFEEEKQFPPLIDLDKSDPEEDDKLELDDEESNRYESELPQVLEKIQTSPDILTLSQWGTLEPEKIKAKFKRALRNETIMRKQSELRSRLLRELAHKRISQLYPDKDLHHFSSEGSSAEIFEDSDNNIYKLYIEKRQKENVGSHAIERSRNYAVKEAKRLKQLQLDQAGPGLIDFNSNNLVVVMKKVDIASDDEITALDRDFLLSEVDRLVGVLNRHQLVYGDNEVVFDKSTGKLIFLDVGGLQTIAESGVKNIYPDKSISDINREEIMTRLKIT